MDPDKRCKGKRKLGEMSRKVGICVCGGGAVSCQDSDAIPNLGGAGLQNNVPESAGSALFQGRGVWRWGRGQHIKKSKGSGRAAGGGQRKIK